MDGTAMIEQCGVSRTAEDITGIETTRMDSTNAGARARKKAAIGGIYDMSLP